MAAARTSSRLAAAGRPRRRAAVLLPAAIADDDTAKSEHHIKCVLIHGRMFVPNLVAVAGPRLRLVRCLKFEHMFARLDAPRPQGRSLDLRVQRACWNQV